MARQTLRLTMLLFLVAVCPGITWAGALDRGPTQQRYNPAAESMIRVPGVVGFDEQQAMMSLQQAGLRVHVAYRTKEEKGLAGKEFTVIDQEPGTAGVAMLGSSVTIWVYRPPGAARPDPYGPSGGGYYDDGYGDDGRQPDDYYDDGYQQQPGGYDEYGNSLPADSAPVPWGGGGQPAEGRWAPDKKSPAAVPEQPVAPQVTPDLANDVRSVPPPVMAPTEPIVATPVMPDRTPVQPASTEQQPSSVEQHLDEKVPARADIRNKMKGVERKITPTPGPTTSPARQPKVPAAASAGRTSGGSDSPAPVQVTPVRPSLTPVTPQAGAQASGTPTFQATPVLPTATAVQRAGGQASQGGTSFTATPVAGAATLANPPIAASPTSGRVQIKIIRFDAVRDTSDPKKDGKKDEIMIAARAILYKVSDGSVLRDIKFKSRVYGDIKDHPERAKAGTARSTGGIKSGDRVNTDITFVDLTLGPDQGLIIDPNLIWEMDDDPTYLDRFFARPTSFYTDRLSGGKDYTRCGVPDAGFYPDQGVSDSGLGDADMGFTRIAGVNRFQTFADQFSIPVGVALRRSHNGVMGGAMPIDASNIRPYYRLTWSVARDISKTNCVGYGEGVMKEVLETKKYERRAMRRKGKKLHYWVAGEMARYDLYLRVVTHP